MAVPTAPAFVPGPVTLEVPATSANLGPGFDCLGLALDLHDRLTAEVVPGGLEIEVVGEGASTLPRDERHLVVKAMRAAFAVLGVTPPGLRLRFENRIPQSRGLGSSSAAIVGGIALANALVDERLRFDEGVALGLANGLEGHPDNVAPALLGGFVVCGQAQDEVWATPAPIDPSISAIAFVPPTGVSTEAARGLLPAQVDHQVAAANTGRAALLVAALGGEVDRLLRGTEDFLHQEYRSSAMPDSFALVQRLRAEGSAAFISGAGPTVLVLTADGSDLTDRCPPGWVARRLAVDHQGVRVVAP
ncbi:homoserine kinase [Nocardioides marmoriginsengisoli]|uniref:Homoserine kinase n=1 Tax=Nocardioides marmoriginsengisoli TaxID=661483 RepID=A0A3N0CQG3_9ACTN|nr:homoserine kinase [Nocardioides marmoriginsengisoli]RNL65256.1 homoserine kinase [Nocardioides marmoriginsengisoli]